jgi:MFS family permease
VGAGRQDELQQYVLTAGELGATAAQTVMVALLPVLLAGHAPSALWIGVAIGGEGVFALLVPFWSGALSDRLSPSLTYRFGRRMVVVGASALVLAAAVAVTPFLSGYWPLAVAAFISFAGLHAYLTPFWALLIDVVPDDRRGRVQGVRGILRSIGLAYGLVGAGLLFGIWQPLPFLVAAALVLATTGLTWAAVLARPRERLEPHRARLSDAWKALLHNRPAFWLLAADAFWNASVDGIRPYFFLYARRVLGTTVSQTSLGLVLLVTGLGAGSWVVGRLGDRHDRLRILEISSIALALAFAAGFLARSVPLALAVAAIAGVAAAAIMTLPYPLYAAMVGDQATGENTGLYVISVTIGRVGAPLLVGGAIDIAARWMPRSNGYPVMWLLSAALAAGGWLCVRRASSVARAPGPSSRPWPNWPRGDVRGKVSRPHRA